VWFMMEQKCLLSKWCFQHPYLHRHTHFCLRVNDLIISHSFFSFSSHPQIDHMHNSLIFGFFLLYFIKKFHTPFSYKGVLCRFSLITVWFWIFWQKNIRAKASHKILMKLTTGRDGMRWKGRRKKTERSTNLCLLLALLGNKTVKSHYFIHPHCYNPKNYPPRVKAKKKKKEE